MLYRATTKMITKGSMFYQTDKSSAKLSEGSAKKISFVELPNHSSNNYKKHHQRERPLSSYRKNHRRSILRRINSTRSRKPASNPVEPAHQKPRYRLHFTWRNVIDRNRDELHWNVGRESIVAGSPIR